jgi:hypothetical protein
MKPRAIAAKKPSKRELPKNQFSPVSLFNLKPVRTFSKLYTLHHDGCRDVALTGKTVRGHVVRY